MKTEKKIKLLDFKLSKSLGNLLFGVYKSRFGGSGMDFSEHREYHFSDPVKSIDWKASAKTEKMQKKVFEEERDLEVLFLLDLSESMYFHFEERKKMDILEEIFYALAFSVEQNNDSLGAYIFGSKETKYIPYSKEKVNIFKVLEAIGNGKKDTKINLEGQIEDLGSMLENISKKSIKNKLIFIFSDDKNPKSYEKFLKNISLQNEVIFIEISDYFEKYLEKLDEHITFQNDSQFLQISLKNKEKLQTYQQKIQEKQEIFEKILKKHKIQLISLDTKMDVFRELLKHLQ